MTFTFVNLYIQDEASNLNRRNLMAPKMQASGEVLLTQRIKVSRGEIHIIEERCKQCRLCIELCPKEVLQEAEKVNEKGYHPPEVVEEPEKGKDCVACGLCELICPEFAIWVEEKKEKASEEGVS